MSSLSKQFILNQGAILGGLQVLLLIILYKTDTLFGSGWSSLSWFIYLGFIYWSAVQYRGKFMGGFISYGKSFAYGVKITVLSGVIIGFFFFVLIKFVDPGLAEVLKAETEEAYLQMGLTEKQVEDMGDGLAMISNPWYLMLSNVFSGLLFGVIFSLIVSFFVKRKGDPFSEAMKIVE